MGWFRQLFGGQDRELAPVEPESPASKFGQGDIDFIKFCGERIVDVVNESMQIAHKSKNIETRRSRVRVAREKIGQLLELAREYPFVTVERLDEVERDIAMIDRTTDEMEAAKPPKRVRKS